MLKFGITLNIEILVKNLFLIINSIFLILNISTFFKKKKKDQDFSKRPTEEEKEREGKIEFIEEKQSIVEFKTIVIEEPKINNEIIKFKVEKMKQD